ncbi:type 1 glutamine amidotransferase [Oenococcus sp.]|uniref:type 1 glutamine amidotransferase n=1 Tax=Oenococcus sp. TaxID=1979414 RepID=UPI0039ED8513
MTAYKLRIAHLYGDLMNTYGDYGNVIALTYYAKQIGVTVDYHLVSLHDAFKAADYDFVLFGGGQDYEESVTAKDLPGKSAEIKAYIEQGGSLLAVCGGFQLLGRTMEFADGKVIDGIGVMSHHTVNLNSPELKDGMRGKRLIGNIEIKNNENGETYHGFENHQGRTFLGEGEKALGHVISGNGNNGDDQTEGVIYRQVYGTYFHGPILTRNGNLAKRILKNALSKRYPEIDWQDKLAAIPTESF